MAPTFQRLVKRHAKAVICGSHVLSKFVSITFLVFYAKTMASFRGKMQTHTRRNLVLAAASLSKKLCFASATQYREESRARRRA